MCVYVCVRVCMCVWCVCVSVCVCVCVNIYSNKRQWVSGHAYSYPTALDRSKVANIYGSGVACVPVMCKSASHGQVPQGQGPACGKGGLNRAVSVLHIL